MTDQEKLIWAAGFFDGEGNVCVARRMTRSHNKGREYWQYQLHVAVSQKNPEPLIILQEILGGTYFRYESCGVSYYRWRISAGQAADGLRKLLPYLVVKLEISTLGIRFQEAMIRQAQEWRYKLQDRDERGRITKQYYPQEVMEEREFFYNEARRMNAKNRANHREPKYTGPLEKFKPKAEAVQ